MVSGSVLDERAFSAMNFIKNDLCNRPDTNVEACLLVYMQDLLATATFPYEQLQQEQVSGPQDASNRWKGWKVCDFFLSHTRSKQSRFYRQARDTKSGEAFKRLFSDTTILSREFYPLIRDTLKKALVITGHNSSTHMVRNTVQQQLSNGDAKTLALWDHKRVHWCLCTVDHMVHGTGNK
jgi:hypothetical protein